MAFVEPQPELPLGDYRRYGRQMILDRFGLQGPFIKFDAVNHPSYIHVGQLKLQNASVVIVGAGGLGCPALQYLAAAGVGEPSVVSICVGGGSNMKFPVL